MPVSRDQILDHVRNHRPLRPRELARALRIPGKDYNRFRRLIQKLVLEGDLVKPGTLLLSLALELLVA